MPEQSVPERYVSPAQVAELLDLTVDDVIALIMDGSLRGARLGASPQWRVAEASVGEYVDGQLEDARRMALWHESNAASFPELWGGARD